MSEKYTPGPWHIHEWQWAESGVTYKGIEDGVEKYTGQVSQSHFNIVADTSLLKSSRTFGSFEGCHIAQLNIAHEGHDEALANARLIAAAPELLEALQLVSDRLGYLSDGFAPDVDPNTLITKWQADIEEVLRKVQP